MRRLDEMLSSARAHLDRVSPSDYEAAVAQGALVVDTRPVEQRQRDGDLEGALVIDRNVLEWRLAPSSDSRIVDIEPDRVVIIVCNQGFSSSLAAASLQELGLTRATDLAGGFEALAEFQAARTTRR